LKHIDRFTELLKKERCLHPELKAPQNYDAFEQSVCLVVKMFLEINHVCLLLLQLSPIWTQSSPRV